MWACPVSAILPRGGYLAFNADSRERRASAAARTLSRSNASSPGGSDATGGNAHGADEWLDLTSLAPTARVLAGFIVDWCGLSTVRPSQAGQYA